MDFSKQLQQRSGTHQNKASFCNFQQYIVGQRLQTRQKIRNELSSVRLVSVATTLKAPKTLVQILNSIYILIDTQLINITRPLFGLQQLNNMSCNLITSLVSVFIMLPMSKKSEFHTNSVAIIVIHIFFVLLNRYLILLVVILVVQKDKF